MEHVLLKAATTAVQEAGIFEAVISSTSIDRELDVVSATGMVDALRKWIPLGKRLPLSWQHSSAPEDIIGYVDPQSARVVGNEVVCSGWIDQDTPRGKAAWRLCKTGVLGFSFGYLVPKGGATPRKGGGRNLNTFDVFEITATAVGPMNNDTRVLGWKGSRAITDEAYTQRERADALAREAEQTAVPTDLAPAEAPERPVEPREAPEPPEARSQRRKAAAFAAEVENADVSQRRRSEEAQLPDVPEPEPEPEPVARAVPDASEQRARARAFEQEISESRRHHESDGLPKLTPEPPQRQEPNPPQAPDTEAQWRKAVTVERDIAARDVSERRRSEEATLPKVPVPEPVPASLEPRQAPEPEGQRREALRHAREAEAEATAARRRLEEDALPSVSRAEPAPAPPAPRQPPEPQSQRREAARLAGESEAEAAAARRRLEEDALPEMPELAPDPEPEPKAIIPESKRQRRRARAMEREAAKARREVEEAALPDLEQKVTAEPFSASHTSNWVARGGGLPHYIQHIAHDLVDQRGMDESRAIATAIAICKRWAAGGKNVSADTRAKAAAAIAEWEKLKASHGKAMGDTVDTAPNDIEAMVSELSDMDCADMFEPLYAAASAHMSDQTTAKSIDPDGQRQKAQQVEREAARTMEEAQLPDVPKGPDYESLKLTPDEMTDLVGALLSNDLPDLRKAFARIPQSNLPQGVKDRLIAKAIEIIDTSKSVDVTGDGQRPRTVDPLRSRAEAVALEHASGGESLRKPPEVKVASPKPVPELALDELKLRARDEMLMALSGLDEI